MWEKLHSFLAKEPEICFEWRDSLTEAKGWVVINSLKGGAAGGGTRMRKGLTRDEVLKLAKTMEVKFNVCGPAIGGAKSGIDFDPQDPRKPEVLMRWFKAVRPLLERYYGTAGDLNVDERLEVSPILRELGIAHPQQGVLVGHYNYNEGERTRVLQRLMEGTELKVLGERYSPMPGKAHYSTTDLITGYGVFESIRHFYNEVKGETLEGKRVFVQGWGNVGAAAGWYLSREGANLVLIQDKEGYLIHDGGFPKPLVDQLMNEKRNNCFYAPGKVPNPIPLGLFEQLKPHIFIPAAASRLVSHQWADAMLDNGLELISSGANVPFDEEEIIMGPLTQKIDARIALIPDFIANCGVARLFSYLLDNKGPVSEEAIFEDTAHTIGTAVTQLCKGKSQMRELTSEALKCYI